MRLRLLVFVVLASAVPAAASGPIDPDVLQARYDRARGLEERELRRPRPDQALLRRLRREIQWAEANDARPGAWRGGRDIPSFRPPLVARAERARNARVAGRLAVVGRSYRGWAAFWYHDLRTGAWAGWNADARFPAASTVKLGALGAALGRWRRPERSPLWYDLRQVGGWSSNLAANRIVRQVGGEAVVRRALRRLGAYASTYPGPYRAGTAAARDVPKPPPHGHVRVTTAHDLGRMLYSLHAAAAGNGYVQRQTRLSARKATLGLALLAAAYPRGPHAGLIRPYVRRSVPIARKEGWLSDTRASAAIVYSSLRGRATPFVLVVLVYRPGVTLEEARAVSRRAVTIVADR